MTTYLVFPRPLLRAEETPSEPVIVIAESVNTRIEEGLHNVEFVRDGNVVAAFRDASHFVSQDASPELSRLLVENSKLKKENDELRGGLSIDVIRAKRDAATRILHIHDRVAAKVSALLSLARSAKFGWRKKTLKAIEVNLELIEKDLAETQKQRAS